MLDINDKNTLIDLKKQTHGIKILRFVCIFGNNYFFSTK